jgi:hypothetical protein
MKKALRYFLIVVTVLVAIQTYFVIYDTGDIYKDQYDGINDNTPPPPPPPFYGEDNIQSGGSAPIILEDGSPSPPADSTSGE